MLAVVAIYLGEVDGRRCGAIGKDRLRILSSKQQEMEENIWQNALKLWKKPC